MRLVALPAVLLALVLLALVGARAALAVDQADRLAAFRERQVNWATATPMPLAQQLADKFTQATGIKVTLLRNSDDALLRRLAEEPEGRKPGAKAGGQTGADVITLTDAGAAIALARKGLLVPFKPDGFDEVIDGAKDKDGRWIAQRVQLAGLSVRTDRVPESERPKAWADLTNSRYKGRMTMADPQASAIALAVAGTLAQRLGWEFVKALRANDTMVVPGHAPLFKAMLQGGRALGIGGLDPRGFNDGKEPPNQAMIVPAEGAFAFGAPVAVVKGAKNPNAARLFAQFMISSVAQRIVTDHAMLSSRADIAPPKGRPALSEVRIMAIDFDRIERDAGDIKARFGEIFR